MYYVFAIKLRKKQKTYRQTLQIDSLYIYSLPRAKFASSFIKTKITIPYLLSMYVLHKGVGNIHPK
jgi:hypothetical protein